MKFVPHILWIITLNEFEDEQNPSISLEMAALQNYQNSENHVFGDFIDV